MRRRPLAKRRPTSGRNRSNGTTGPDVPLPRTPRVESRLDALFANSENTFLESVELRAFGLIVFAMMADWKAWVGRRVETVTFLDPDTVRRQVSVDFTVPELPTIFELEGRSLQFLPLALLRKRRLTHFDLHDETGKTLPLITGRANGALAASALVEAARAFQSNQRLDAFPRGNLSDDLWQIATLPTYEARAVWRSLALIRDGDTPRERDLRQALTKSWRFMSFANDLSRNLLVATPLLVDGEERRIIKFAYTEQARYPRSLARPQLSFLSTRGVEDGPRCTLTIGAIVESGTLLSPLVGLRFELLEEDDPTHRKRARTWAGGEWSDQVAAGNYRLVIKAPAGLMLTGHVDQSSLTIQRDTTVNLIFRPVPDPTGPKAPRLSIWRKLLRQVGWDPKTVEIRVPAAAQARSYHFEYVVSAGMQATWSCLRTQPVSRSLDGDSPGTAPAEAPALLPPPDWHTKTEHRVHLYRVNVPQEYAGIAEIKLRARTSTILRGASWVSLLSLTMVGILRWRWSALGPGAIEPEVALLLAVPGGLSAYVARSQSDTFTSMVLVGLRGLALSSAIWCLAAGTLIATSRAVWVTGNGITRGGADGLDRQAAGLRAPAQRALGSVAAEGMAQKRPAAGVPGSPQAP
jgi:hypothetical protein